MLMAWFFPVSILIGLVGTQTARQSRHSAQAKRGDRGWMLMLVLAWMPLVCWACAQLVLQD